MLRYGIAQFVGSWVSESGYKLRIKKVRKGLASVDFLDPRCAPVQRPYMGGAPTLKMVAHYDDYNGMFEVDLWEEGKGFILDLTHEYDYELDLERRKRSCQPSAEMSEIVFSMRGTHYSARWITLCEERRRTSCLVAVLVEVGDVKLAAGFDARAGIEIEIENRAIPCLQQRVSGRHAHQLPRTGLREGAGFIDGVAGFARYELRVGRIGEVRGAQIGNYELLAFLTNPSSPHSSAPTPLCTKNNPVGSYFFFTDASRG
jgi:hypothetical protein